TGTQQVDGPVEISAEEAELTEMVEVVFASTEDVWTAIFASAGSTFEPGTRVFYRDQTPTVGCGMGASAYGPFYCPPDSKVCIDLNVYGQFREEFGARGDLAMSYVVAHEVAPPIQNPMGTLE